MREVAQIKKEDIHFGLDPATSSLCTLERMILFCGPQLYPSVKWGRKQINSRTFWL